MKSRFFRRVKRRVERRVAARHRMGEHTLVHALCLVSAASALALALLSNAARNKDIPSPAKEGAEGVYISVYDDETGLSVMPLEEYLLGVVAAEMPASFSLEALKAQSVAARTYAVRKLASLGGEPCGRHGADICTDSTCCQAYRTSEELSRRWGAEAEFYFDKIAEAVRETEGIIATYEGAPIEALYHSTSGGATEAAKDVFGADIAYLTSVASPGEENASHYEDSFAFTRAEFVEKLNKAFPKACLKKSAIEVQLEILSRASGGRVKELRLGDTTVTGRELRRALELPSAAFTFSVTDAGVTVDTRGYGHGVGMSQYGADAMARAGADYRDIIRHYYQGSELTNLAVR